MLLALTYPAIPCSQHSQAMSVRLPHTEQLCEVANAPVCPGPDTHCLEPTQPLAALELAVYFGDTFN